WKSPRRQKAWRRGKESAMSTLALDRDAPAGRDAAQVLRCISAGRRVTVEGKGSHSALLTPPPCLLTSRGLPGSIRRKYFLPVGAHLCLFWPHAIQGGPDRR